MSVRNIPLSKRSITGTLSSNKSDYAAKFESSLERDFLILLEFDVTVSKFIVQPVKVPYCDQNSIQRTYTPDVLCHYVDNSFLVPKPTKTVLYEVKYRSDLKENWLKYKVKFRAAMKYAHTRGWKYSIVTEREIRTDYFRNARFLLSYRKLPLDNSLFSAAMDHMEELRETDPETLVSVLSRDFDNKAENIFLVWQMLAKNYIKADLSIPLTMKSKIWLPYLPL